MGKTPHAGFSKHFSKEMNEKRESSMQKVHTDCLKHNPGWPRWWRATIAHLIVVPLKPFKNSKTEVFRVKSMEFTFIPTRQPLLLKGLLGIFPKLTRWGCISWLYLSTFPASRTVAAHLLCCYAKNCKWSAWARKLRSFKGLLMLSGAGGRDTIFSASSRRS